VSKQSLACGEKIPIFFSYQPPTIHDKLAEGVGFEPTIDKALKINERFRRCVLQDYRTSVPAGKGEFFRSEPTRFPKWVLGVNES
jgi:hypothetical protein